MTKIRCRDAGKLYKEEVRSHTITVEIEVDPSQMDWHQSAGREFLDKTYRNQYLGNVTALTGYLERCRKQYGIRVTIDSDFDVIKTEIPLQWPFCMTEQDLFAQGQIWVDSEGNKRVIASMSLDYIANVIKNIRDRDYSWISRPAKEETVLMRALKKRLSDVVDNPFTPY